MHIFYLQMVNFSAQCNELVEKNLSHLPPSPKCTQVAQHILYRCKQYPLTPPGRLKSSVFTEKKTMNANQQVRNLLLFWGRCTQTKQIKSVILYFFFFLLFLLSFYQSFILFERIISVKVHYVIVLIYYFRFKFVT